MPPLYDYDCGACGHKDALVIKISELPEGPEVCPYCQCPEWNRVILKAPSGRMKGTYAQDTARLQQSLKERFVKKDLDDARHKHGSVFDDSLRGAAVDRIKRGEA